MSESDVPAVEVLDTAAAAVQQAFLRFHDDFNSITRRSRARFESRDWHGCESDVVERLRLYSDAVDRTIDGLGVLLGRGLRSRPAWSRILQTHAARLGHRPNRELAETFFSSVTRRVFSTEGVDPAIEYVSTGPGLPDRAPASWLYRRYEGAGSDEIVQRILEDYRFDAAYGDLSGDARLAATRLDARLERQGQGLVALEILRPVFYRMKHAYLIGRVCDAAGAYSPFILALLHDEAGIRVDALMLDAARASILFSFTRAHFHVESECPVETILFLRSLMPHKRVAELYISLGFDKHGKTELYRDLEHYLDRSADRFEIATGDRGMVMIVFTLPGNDLVFKIIRDRFPYPKNTSAADVRRRYRLVFERDRVGRLVEAQEFEHLRFPRALFAPELLDELRREAARTVTLDETHVTLSHLYIERKVCPLNLYLRERDAAAVEHAVIDYGDAIKELAAANIFPGDFLLKNFGVTRHGRVVFYDYDELCLLTDCTFRALPAARTDEDELSAEPWFTAGEHDIFPEEFRRFLGLAPRLLRPFEAHHGDLFTAEFWCGLQRRLAAGEILDFYPYPAADRLERAR